VIPGFAYGRKASGFCERQLCDLATFSAQSNKAIRSNKHLMSGYVRYVSCAEEPLDESIFSSLVTFKRSTGQTFNADSGGQL